MALKTLFRFTLLAAVIGVAQASDVPADPYRWLEAKENPKVQAWVSAQDERARRYLAQLPGREKLEARLSALLNTPSTSLPRVGGTRLFYTRTDPGQQKPVFYWQERGKEHVLLDPNLTEEPIDAREWHPSPKGRFLLYFTNPRHGDEAVIHVREVGTGNESPRDVIPGATYADPSWTPDERGFYYMALPMDKGLTEDQRVARAPIRFHTLGTDPAADRIVYPPTGDGRLFLSPSVSRDGRWLFIKVINGWTSNDIYWRPEDSSAPFKPLFISTTSTAEVYDWGDKFYELTNSGSALKYEIRADRATAADLHWSTIVPERPDTVIQKMDVLADRLVLTTAHNALIEAEIRNLDGSLDRAFQPPTLGSITGVSGSPESPDIYIQFESYAQPSTIYRVPGRGGNPVIWARDQAPLDASAFMVEQLWFGSKDNTKVSMFLVHPRNWRPDGKAPVLLHGYGGFNVMEVPRFYAMVVPWLEAGGAFADVQLRGDGEYGETWHEQGMGRQKQHTFDDMIAAAQYLIREHYTSPEHLALDGTSNGGLTVAATLVQHAELFRAVVCKVPLTDMIRYPLFGEGKSWIPEYGSPDDPADFATLRAYSPYHNVRPARYPAVLLISAENDDRVDPMHARKFASILQANQQGPLPILLETERQAGHTGSDLRKAEIQEFTDRLSFLLSMCAGAH